MTAPVGGVEITTVGVFDLPKAPVAVIALSDRVAWDDAAKQVVLPGAGLYHVGIALAAAGNGTTAVRLSCDRA